MGGPGSGRKKGSGGGKSKMNRGGIIKKEKVEILRGSNKKDKLKSSMEENSRRNRKLNK